MKKQLQLTVSALALAGAVFAQQNEIRKEQVIIRKDGNGKEEKMTVVVKGDSVLVNGKPVQEGDGHVVIRRGMMGIPPDMGEPAKPQAFLGVNIEKAENGVRIVNVSEGSNAEKAGLKEGDIIVSLAGKTETDPEGFRNLVRAQKPMEEVEIVYIPAGEKKEKKIKVKLGSMTSISKTFTYTMPGSNFEPGNFDFKTLPDNMTMVLDQFNPKPRLGVKIQDTEDNSGVKVLDVTDESLAAQAGVQKEDVLISIDGKEVKDTDAAREAIQSVKDKTGYMLKVKRNGKTIELKVPKKLKEANL